MLGPIDYIAVGFEGNNFDGSILSELAKAVDSGVIRLVDLVFIIKDTDGTITVAEIEDQPKELKEALKVFGFKNDTPLLTEGDAEKLGEAMDDNTSAGVLVIEHLWAKGLKKALIKAGGILVAEGRIHPDTVLAAAEDLELEASKA